MKHYSKFAISHRCTITLQAEVWAFASEHVSHNYSLKSDLRKEMDAENFVKSRNDVDLLLAEISDDGTNTDDDEAKFGKYDCILSHYNSWLLECFLSFADQHFLSCWLVKW